MFCRRSTNETDFRTIAMKRLQTLTLADYETFNGAACGANEGILEAVE